MTPSYCLEWSQLNQRDRAVMWETLAALSGLTYITPNHETHLSGLGGDHEAWDPNEVHFDE